MADLLTASLQSTHKGWARWNMVNQDDELIVSHLNTISGEAVYKSIEKQWPFTDQRASGIIPINHVLSYQVLDRSVTVGAPLVANTDLRLVADWQAQEFRRIHLHGCCRVQNDADQTVAIADYWIALTKPFAQPGQRRLTEIPEPLQHLQIHDYPSDALPLQDVNAFCLDNPDINTSHREYFHRNQTDLNHHVNTIVYLDIAQDRVATLAGEAGLPLADMHFRELDVFYRKPFAAGQKYTLDIDLNNRDDNFEAMVRFSHMNAAGDRDNRVSVGLRLSGRFGVDG